MKRLVTVLMIGVLMLGLFGCANSKRYNVDYCGEKEFYKGAKDSYKAGETVHLEYGPIATEMNYHFQVNVDSYSCQGGDDCFIIEFVMPEHDVVVENQSQSAMEFSS